MEDGDPGDGFMYVLEAADDDTEAKYCQAPEVVPSGNASTTVCQVLYGIDVSEGAASADDYNAGGVQGRILDFLATKSSESELGDVNLEACHIQAFVKAPVFNVDAKDHSSSNDTGTGTGLDTGIVVVEGHPLIVHTDPDELWTSGACPRYSNADGQTVYLEVPANKCTSH